MTVLNVAMYGSDELAKDIAKATDQRDVHTYVHKEYHDSVAKIISIIRPARYPERLRPLLNAISAGRVGIIEITAIDATLGEVLVAFASSSIRLGIAVINPPDSEWIDNDMVKKMFEQAGLTHWKFMNYDGLEIRRQLYTLMDEIDHELIDAAASPLVVSIDQHFNVKGIGLVAIGYVQSGSVSVHDELHLLPAEGPGTVKSLQVMDDDVEQAVAGDRVGIALRNTKEEHLTGGSLVTHPAVEDKNKGISIPLCLEKHEKSSIELSVSPFQKRVLAVGDVVHASVDLQFVVGRVESIGSGLEVAWDSPLFIRTENPPVVLLAQLDSKPRILGSAKLTRLS